MNRPIANGQTADRDPAPGLATLRDAARAMASERGMDWPSVLGDAGLFLLDPPRRAYYDVTPRDSVTFAYTGGDGVHFGVLCAPEAPDADPDDGPVVMTVPMGRAKRIVLAGSVGEFLSLGASDGWFGLEQLAYDPARVHARHAAGGAADPDAAELLDRLGLAPARLDAARLEALAARYDVRA
jgi:hypothetical protein